MAKSFQPLSCVFKTPSSGCAGTATACPVLLLPELTVTIVLCDAHRCLLRSRAETVLGMQARLEAMGRELVELREQVAMLPKIAAIAREAARTGRCPARCVEHDGRHQCRDHPQHGLSHRWWGRLQPSCSWMDALAVQEAA